MNTSVGFVFLGDMKNPATGKTWCQENSEKMHNIPLGAIVECLPYGNTPEEDYNEHTGLRLFVVEHNRDFDQTPLYSLSYMPLAEYLEKTQALKNLKITWADQYLKRDLTGRASMLINYRINGIAEEDLKVIKLPIKKE